MSIKTHKEDLNIIALLQVYKHGALPSHIFNSSFVKYILCNCSNIYIREATPTSSVSKDSFL